MCTGYELTSGDLSRGPYSSRGCRGLIQAVRFRVYASDWATAGELRNFQRRSFLQDSVVATSRRTPRTSTEVTIVTKPDGRSTFLSSTGPKADLRQPCASRSSSGGLLWVGSGLAWASLQHEPGAKSAVLQNVTETLLTLRWWSRAADFCFCRPARLRLLIETRNQKPQMRQ